jgi:predicted DNA-binding protein (MmcQ/YjbR family)
MTPDSVREFCLALPHVTESIQWSNHLVLKVGGKMFAVAALEPSPVWISLKCTDEDFAELTERPGIIPAPYLARHHWIALETKNALTQAELKLQLRRAHEAVFEKLPKMKKEQLRRSK